ncbi:MAG: beta strand repeat-containing protein [Flavisolibacter sp.]
MNNVYPVTSTRRRKGAARGRESNVLHSPYETCTWFFKTMTSKVAILLYVAIFSVLGQQALAQTCATSVSLVPAATSVCTDASTGTATVSFTVTTNPEGGLASSTIRLYRDGNPVEVASVVASGTATNVTITDPSAPAGVHGYDVTVLKTGCSNVQSAPGAVQVTVYGTPYVSGVEADQTICSGAQPSFDVYVTGPITGTLSITVHNNLNNTDFTVSGVAASTSGTTTVTVTPNPAPVQTTSYTITGVAASVGGCTASATTYTHTITVNTQPPVGNINANPSPVCAGGLITIAPTGMGTILGGTVTYTWYKDGNPVCAGAPTCTTGQGSEISGQGTPTLTIDNAQPGDAGNYYLEVLSDDPNYAACGGRGQSNVLNVIVYPLPTATFSPASADVCVNSNTVVTVNFTGTAPYSLNYTLNGVAQTPITTSSSSYGITVPTGTPGSTQTYSITSVSDAHCVNSVNIPSSATFNVSGFTFTPTAATTTVCYGATTSIAVASQGATGTVTYTLGATTKTAVAVAGLATATFTGIPAGTYTLTATNSGCTVAKSVTIGTYGQATVSAVTNSPISCNGGSTSATATITGDAGNYDVNVTNGTYNVTNNVTKGATATSTSFYTLPAGVYTVTSTNTGTGCSVTSSLTVLQPAAIVVTATPGVTALPCNGGSTTIAASVTGGNTGVFTYVLTGTSSGATLTSTTGVTFTNVIAGSYTITVTDSKNCTGTITGINITQPTALTGTVTVANATCNAGTGTVTFTTNGGGTAPYRYSISGGLSGASAATTSTTYNYVNVAPGTYTATVIDANNCTQVLGVVTVTAPAAVTASVTAGQIQCNGGTTTLSITNITGGNQVDNIIFTLTGPAGSTSLTSAGTATQTAFYPVSAGTYTLTAGNEGCPSQVVGTVTVTEPAAIVVTPSATAITCVNGTSTVTIAATAGGATLSYQLIDANTSNQFGSTVTNNTGSAVFSNVPAGTYNYIVTNTATGCVQQSTPGNPATQIVIDPVTQVVLGAPAIEDVTCYAGSNGSIAIRPSGGASGTYQVTAVGPNSYSVTKAGTSTVTFTGLFAGTYTITAVDGNGCSTSSSVIAVVGGGTASGTGAPDLILTSSASTNTFPTTETTVAITYGVSNPSGNAATGVVLRVSKPTPDYTVTLDPSVTGWTHSGGTDEYEEFTFGDMISCGTFTPIEVTVIVTRTAAAVGKGSFPVTGNVRSSVEDANDADNTRVDRLNAQ